MAREEHVSAMEDREAARGRPPGPKKAARGRPPGPKKAARGRPPGPKKAARPKRMSVEQTARSTDLLMRSESSMRGRLA